MNRAEHGERDSGRMVHAPWLDLPPEIAGQLLAKEEILRSEAAVGGTRQRYEVQEITCERSAVRTISDGQ